VLALPHTSIVNRVVPKNSFDKFISTKQKKSFTDFIERIKWTNKLSKETIKLDGKEIKEIQVFEIHLKKKLENEELLNIIDKHIPYHIVFLLLIENEILFSVAKKHPNPTSEDACVIDWRFSSAWLENENKLFELNLRKSLDDVFSDFCLQVSGKHEDRNKSLQEIIAREQIKKQLILEINKLEAEIKSSKHFKLKVEFNLKLNQKRNELKAIK
jgi:hypothetical protein